MDFAMLLLSVLVAAFVGQAHSTGSGYSSGMWSRSTGGMFNAGGTANGKTYYASGILKGNKVYGWGSYSESGSGSGSSMSTSASLCFAGKVKKDKWSVVGTAGQQKLSAKGDYSITSAYLSAGSSQYSGSVSLGFDDIKMTPGAAPSMCGSYSFSFYSYSGSGSAYMNAWGSTSTYDANGEQSSYSVTVSSMGEGQMSGTVSGMGMSSGSGTSSSWYSSGCLTSITMDEKNGKWHSFGHVGGRPFKSKGILDTGFWTTTNIKPGKIANAFNGGFSSSACPSGSGSGSGSGCSHSISGGFGNLYEYFMGSAFSNKTWYVEREVSSLLPRVRFSGSFTDDGKFEGKGETTGLSWSAKGHHGLGCFVATKQSVTCASGGVPLASTSGTASGSGGLVAYAGCGEMSKDGLNASGTYNGKPWTALAKSSRTASGYSIVSGKVTYDTNEYTFSTSGSIGSGHQLNFNIGQTSQSVSAYQVGDAVILVGSGMASSSSSSSSTSSGARR